MKKTPPEGYISEADAARLSGLSLSTLRQGRSVRKGRLNVPPSGRFHDRWPRVFYGIDELKEWAAENGIDLPADMRGNPHS